MPARPGHSSLDDHRQQSERGRSRITLRSVLLLRSLPRSVQARRPSWGDFADIHSQCNHAGASGVLGALSIASLKPYGYHCTLFPCKSRRGASEFGWLIEIMQSCLSRGSESQECNEETYQLVAIRRGMSVRGILGTFCLTDAFDTMRPACSALASFRRLGLPPTRVAGCSRPDIIHKVLPILSIVASFPRFRVRGTRRLGSFGRNRVDRFEHPVPSMPWVPDPIRAPRTTSGCPDILNYRHFCGFGTSDQEIAGISWPIFDLDRKNPHDKDDLEHLSP